MSPQKNLTAGYLKQWIFNILRRSIILSIWYTQLANGDTRMTPRAGLQIFMPDFDELPHTKANQSISMECLRIAIQRRLPI